MEHSVLPHERKSPSSGLTFALQALLSRHESYIQESRLEHDRLTNHVSELESERTSLQTANERMVAENRNLLEQLERLNDSLKSSESHVHDLENMLKDCEVEMKRLTGLARKIEELEMKLVDMERERAVMIESASENAIESKTSLSRWRESERKVRELEDQLQQIEYEAKKDREKHEEIVARLEKERLLDRELGGAEGRLKGAAAVQGLASGSDSSKNVVSHFVRDILQDNANLQAGISELRELLQVSNDEVQNLREQVLQHQPIETNDSDHRRTPSVSLDEQLELADPAKKHVQKEVHVHHHYHAKLAARKDRTPTVRRNSKRKTILPHQTRYGSVSDSSVPSTPISRPYRYSSSPIIPYLHQPQPRKNRWSVQSAVTQSSTFSSIPSSPRSYHDRNSYIFDRLERDDDEYSRPTSPESAAGLEDSNQLWDFTPAKQRKASEPLNTFVEEPIMEEPAQIPEVAVEDSILSDEATAEDERHGNEPPQDLTPKPSMMLVSDIVGEPALNEAKLSTINIQPDPKPPDLETPLAIQQPTKPEQKVPLSTTNFDLIEIRPSIRRAKSHESLISISGMDIHLVNRPKNSPAPFAPFLRGNSSYFANSPSTTRKVSATQPLVEITEFNAISSSRFSTSSITSLSNQLGASKAIAGLAAVSSNAARRDSTQTVSSGSSTTQPAPSGAGLGRLVGGWVRGKWGVAPMKSSNDLKSSSSSVISSSASDNTAAADVVESTPKARKESVSPTVDRKSTLPREPKQVSNSSQNAMQAQGRPLPKPSLTSPLVLTTPEAQRPKVESSTNVPLELSSSIAMSFSPPMAIPMSSTTYTNDPDSSSKLHIRSSSYSQTLQSQSYSASFMMNRPPGINQKGFIPGVWTAKQATPKLHAEEVDVEELKDALG